MENINRSNTIASSSLGNILEWYDFGLFTIFSPIFSRQFFPNSDPNSALIATLGIFAVGFLCRPIGALLFGYLGDRSGRVKALRLSILIMTLPTLFIGFLPTYQQIGLAAPILLIIIRMWQGISIGGEYSGNIVYLAETSPKKFRGLYTALANMGSNLGILLAAVVGLLTSILFSKVILESWGWRIPYILSGIVSLLIYYFRLKMKETNVFNHLRQKKLLTANPIHTLFKKNLFQLLRTVGLVCMGTTFYYFCFVYIPVYLTQEFYLSTKRVSFLMSSLIALMIIIVPLSGLLSDLIGRKKMLVFNASFILMIILPGYYWLQISDFNWIIFILGIYTLGSALEQGTTGVALVENFPPPARYTGVSFGYNLGNGILGGTVPLICEWLRQTHTFAPAYYIAVCATITWLVSIFLVPNQAAPKLEIVSD